ncbi:hypothetical protein pb186bvf_005093 [Paramecium bursaria]
MLINYYFKSLKTTDQMVIYIFLSRTSDKAKQGFEIYFQIDPLISHDVTLSTHKQVINFKQI